MPDRIHLQGVTGGVRHSVIDELREVIGNAGGWIVDFHLFSNLAISLIFELERSRLTSLIDQFERIDIRLSDASIEILSDPDRHAGEGDLRVLFNLAFQNGDGDLRTPIPAIPG